MDHITAITGLLLMGCLTGMVGCRSAFTTGTQTPLFDEPLSANQTLAATQGLPQHVIPAINIRTLRLSSPDMTFMNSMNAQKSKATS